MSYQTILFDVSGGVARLTLNRPERLNSFNTAMHAEVREALASVERSDARVLILTGAGRGFCAGQDLGDRAVAPGGAAVDLGESIEKNYKPLVMTLRNLPMPVIAAVNGVAAGAGANIALACDMVIAAKSASFVQAFRETGVGTGLRRDVVFAPPGWKCACHGLSFLGDKLPAEQAAQWGLIWRCVEDAELAPTVDALAQQFASAPTRGLARTKQAIYEGWGRPLEAQLDIERDYQRELGYSADYAEGVAAFSKRARRSLPAAEPDDSQPTNPCATSRSQRIGERDLPVAAATENDAATVKRTSPQAASRQRTQLKPGAAQRLAERAAEALFARDTTKELLGIRIISVQPGGARAGMTVRQDMVNGHRTCHGGLIFSLADSAFAAACNSHNESNVGGSARSTFWRPRTRGMSWWPRPASCGARGRSGIYEIKVTNQRGELIALFRGRSHRIGGTVTTD